METIIQNFLDKNFDITKKEVKTPLGTIQLALVKNRFELLKHIGFISIDREHISDEIFKADDKKEVWKIYESKHIFEFLQMVRDLKLELFGLYNYYLEVRKAFRYVFKEDVFDKINNIQDYEFIVGLICEVNGFARPKVSKNKEIAYYDNLKRELDKAQHGDVDFEAIYTTVWAYTGNCPDDMTLYQLNALFSRIATIKSYDTSVSVAVAGGKGKIVPYYAKLDKTVNNEKIITSDGFGKSKPI